MKNRIWELDAFRGICILGVVAVHGIYDLVELYGILHWNYPHWFSFIKDWGGILFLLLSGICATLGRRSFRRGLIVFCCGMLCSAVTAGMYFLEFAGYDILIWFGVLHCLGICMMLWSVLKKLPTWALGLLGAAIAVAGFAVSNVRVDCTWLFPLGLRTRYFASSDYFPLMPHLGFFLLGSVLGRTLYRRQQTLLPRVNSHNPLIRGLCFCGRQSLFIYLLHQPLLAGICTLITLL